MNIVTYWYRTLKGLPPYESTQSMRYKIPFSVGDLEYDLAFRETDVHTFGAITAKCDEKDDLLSSLEVEKRAALIYESARK